MADGPLKLCWKEQLVGVITDATWSDFPWLSGRFEVRQMDEQQRQVLAWFAAQTEADELEEPPFAAEWIGNWAIVKADGSRVELLAPPIIDFSKGMAEWRE